MPWLVGGERGWCHFVLDHEYALSRMGNYSHPLLNLCITTAYCGHSGRGKAKDYLISITFDRGILLESWTIARLSAETVLSQDLSSHIAGALETLVPHTCNDIQPAGASHGVVALGWNRMGVWPMPRFEEIIRLSQTIHCIAEGG